MTDEFLHPTTCVFCTEAADPGSANAFLGEDWPYDGRVLLSTGTCFAIPGYGPQVYPYVLIVSRRHFSSLGESTPNERRDVISILKALQRLEMFASRRLAIYEHGGCDPLRSCIDHFHLHIIDSSYRLSAAISGFSSKRVRVGPSNALRVDGPYLLAASYSRGESLTGKVAPLDSKDDQFFRRALARHLGESEWDWRLGMNYGYMLQMVQHARAAGFGPSVPSDGTPVNRLPV